MDENDIFDTLLEAIAQQSRSKVDMDAAAKELYSVYKSFKNAGFTSTEAFKLLLAMVGRS